jgi:hypothetical protein
MENENNPRKSLTRGIIYLMIHFRENIMIRISYSLQEYFRLKNQLPLRDDPDGLSHLNFGRDNHVQ